MKIFLIFILLYLINGCSAMVITSVTRVGRNFDKNKNICISLPEKSKNDLELSTYKNYIESILTKNGYKVSSQSCEYTLLMEYGVWQGKQLINVPIMTTINTKFGQQSQISGYSTHEEAYYTRKLDINIFDQSDNKVFQGNAISNGSTPQFLPVSQCVINAIFKQKNKNDNQLNYTEYFTDECKM